MSDEPASQVESKPFWQSKTVIGLVVAFLAPLLARHLGATESETQEIVGYLVGGAGVVLGIYGRRKATQPITLGVKPVQIGTPISILCFALFLTGCSGTRLVESAELNGTVTRDPAGGTTGTGGVRLYFRDARDAKSIKPLGLRDEETTGPGEEVIRPKFRGAESIVVTRFPEEAR